MADQKLSELTELATTPAVGDELYIRDISEAAADESKRITVANLMAATSAGATIVRKTADQTVNNSTTLVNDTHLLHAIAANEVWYYEFVLSCTSASATPDLDFTIVVPADATGHWWAHDSISILAASDPITPTAFAAEKRSGCWASANYRLLYALVINAGNAGNVQLQWAQGTATVEDTKVLTNSFLKAIQIAG